MAKIEMHLKHLAIKEIEVKDRARQDFGNLEDLKQSIIANGLISPIAVQEVNGGFRLLAGERRLRACTELGWANIDAKVFKGELTEYDIFSIELAENVDRKDFTWQEKIRLESKIHERQVGFHGEKISSSSTTGWSQADTAKFLGVSPGALSQNLKLASAMEAVPELAACKTKEDANKMLRMLQEKVIHEELLRRVAQRSGDPTQVSQEENQIKMIEAYQLGDALELLPTLEAESFDFIEIDPPYGIDLHAQKKGDAEHSEYVEVDDVEYLGFLGKVLDEAVRVLKPLRWIVVWNAHDKLHIVRQMLVNRGLTVPSTGPAMWVKPSGQVNHPERAMASCWEGFVYAGKGNAVLFKQGRSNVFHSPPVPPQRKIHPTEKPIELLQQILQVFALEGYKVLVPFLGSGVTLMAAANSKLEAVGFDLSKVYKRSYEMRILSQSFGQYFNTVEKG